METKNTFCIFFLLINLMFIVISDGWTQTKAEMKAPVITHSYAVEKGRYGTTWKIYLEAEDPDGDMTKIVSVVEQSGYGRYSTDFITLKPQYGRYFKGFIQWNTFSNRASYLREWTQINLIVSILDKSGNESKEVVFPFTFETGAGREPKPSAPFDQGEIPKLGNIFIDLFEPTSMGHGPRDD